MVQPQLGRATQFFRQRLIGRPSTAAAAQMNTSGTDFSFAQLTESEYRVLLEDGGYSQHYIEDELAKLNLYRQLMETDAIKAARAKVARINGAEDDPQLAEYMKASERRKKRLRDAREDNGNSRQDWETE